MITASLGKGPRGREVARAEAAKNDSPRIPEASAADPPAPSCKNFRREGVVRLQRESLPTSPPPNVAKAAHTLRQIIATGERSAFAGSIISETPELESNLQRQLHVKRFSRPNARCTVIVSTAVCC